MQIVTGFEVPRESVKRVVEAGVAQAAAGHAPSAGRRPRRLRAERFVHPPLRRRRRWQNRHAAKLISRDCVSDPARAIGKRHGLDHLVDPAIRWT